MCYSKGYHNDIEKRHTIKHGNLKHLFNANCEYRYIEELLSTFTKGDILYAIKIADKDDTRR